MGPREHGDTGGRGRKGGGIVEAKHEDFAVEIGDAEWGGVDELAGGEIDGVAADEG